MDERGEGPGRKQPEACPRCAGKELVRIVYGYPSDEGMKAASEGRIKLGGCCVSGNDPQWQCKSCGHAF